MKKFRLSIAALMSATVLISASPQPAQAAGCLKGAVIGGVAGHFAGHHAILGAIGGCIINRHLTKKKASREREEAAYQKGLMDAHRAHITGSAAVPYHLPAHAYRG